MDEFKVAEWLSEDVNHAISEIELRIEAEAEILEVDSGQGPGVGKEFSPLAQGENIPPCSLVENICSGFVILAYLPDLSKRDWIIFWVVVLLPKIFERR